MNLRGKQTCEEVNRRTTKTSNGERTVIEKQDRSEAAAVAVSLEDLHSSPANSYNASCRPIELCIVRNSELENIRELSNSESNNLLLEKRIFAFKNLSDSSLLMYTGIERPAFLALSIYLKQFLPFEYYTGNRVTCLDFDDQLLCCLLKLKQNPTDLDIGFRFGVSRKTIYNIFMTFLNVLYETLFEGLLAVKMPSATATKKCLPECFEKFPSCRVVIDCTEIKIDTPRNDLNAMGATYSNYKSNYTAKFLVGVAPNGTIIFVSEAFPGNASDKSIVKDSELLSHLNAGDLILADKGFTIHDILPPGVHLNLPPFLYGKPKCQFTEAEARYTRDLARARIHVERANQRIKTFHILKNFPVHYRPFATRLFRVCCCLVNLQNPLISGIFSKDE